MSEVFDHEKLKVYQRALDFVEFTDALLSTFPKSMAVCDQLDRASTSIPLNIAGGDGKFTSKDRCRFFDIARGSALECATALDVLVRKGKSEETTGTEGKEILREVVSMLVGLIRSQKTDRVYEDQGDYGSGD